MRRKLSYLHLFLIAKNRSMLTLLLSLKMN